MFGTKKAIAYYKRFIFPSQSYSLVVNFFINEGTLCAHFVREEVRYCDSHPTFAILNKNAQPLCHSERNIVESKNLLIKGILLFHEIPRLCSG